MDAVELSICSLVITILFGLLGVYYYLKSRQIKKDAMLFSNIQIQKKKHPQIKIFFNTTEVEDLRKLSVLYLNIGNTTIKKDDLCNNDVSNIILNSKYKILTTPEIRNKTNIRFSESNVVSNSYLIRYDFLKPGENAIFSVYYNKIPIDSVDKKGLEFISPLIENEKSIIKSYPSNLFIDFNILLYLFFSMLIALVGIIVFSFLHNNLLAIIFLVSGPVIVSSLMLQKFLFWKKLKLGKTISEFNSVINSI